MSAGIILFAAFAVCLIVGVPVSISLGVASLCSVVAFRAKCKIFSRHLQKPILKTEKGRFKGL